VLWKSDVVGNFTMDAVINSEAVNATDEHKWRLFKNADLDENLSELHVNPAGPLVANGNDSYNVNVVIKDINNVTAPFVEVEFLLIGNTADDIEFLNNGASTGFTSACTTNSSGMCSTNVTLRSKIAGTYTIAAKINNKIIDNVARVFIAGPIDEGHTILTITPDNNVTADGIDHYNLSVRAADIFDNAINGTQINFTVGGGNLTNVSCLTNVNGACEVNWTSTIVGTYQVNASVEGNDSLRIQNSGAMKEFVSDNASVQHSNITAIPNEVTIEEYSTITVTLRDAKGNLVSDSSSYSVIITTDLSGSSFDSGTGNSITLTNINGGIYQAILRSTKPGLANITFSINNVLSTNTASVLFNHGDPCLDNSGVCSNSTTSIVAEPNPQTAGQNSTVIVHISDKNGNDVINATNVVVFIKEDNTANNNASLYTGGNATHVGGGNYTVNLISYTTGNVTVGFRINANESALSEVVVFNPDDYDINGTYTTIVAMPNKTIAGNSSLITVFLADSGGNGVPGQNVDIIVKDGDIGSGNLTSAIDVGGGNYTAVLMSTLANNITVGFTVSSAESNKTAVVEFEAGSGNASLSNISVNPSILNVGNTSIVTVTLLDSYGNTITTGGENVSIIIVNPVTGLELNNNMTTNGIFARAIDNGDGTYTAYLTSSISVNANITFTINDIYPDPIVARLSNTTIDTIVSFNEYEIDLYVTLNASTKQARIGELIRYTAVIENRGGTNAANFTLSNIVPKGFSFVEGSVLVGGNKSNTVTWNSSLGVDNLRLDTGETMTIMYMLRVGAGVRQGSYVTQTSAYRTPELNANEKISNTASASVEILINDPLFDESLIFGTVYHDKNSNGKQDEGEEGLPGVKIVTVEGYVIITDQFGRYHLLNILGGEWGMGRNFIMKVDPSSIPKGSKFTTENPLLRRITPGIPVRFDFGVALMQEEERQTDDNATDVQTLRKGGKK
jgi:uncharacterized repeat protein (TIGR01451 family)